MFLSFLLLLCIFQETQPGEMTLPQLQAGYTKNAEKLSKYRVVFTKKTVLAEGYKIYHSSLLSISKDQLKSAKDEKMIEQLERNIQHETMFLEGFDKMKLQALHFDYRTDGQNYLLACPQMQIPWENVKDSWQFPDGSVTKKSLTDDYLDYEVLSCRPGTDRRYLWCVGMFNSYYNVTKSDSFPTINYLCFPPLTKRSFTTDNTRHPLDGFLAAQPVEVIVKRKEQSPLYTVTFYGKDENASLFTQNEKEYQGRIRLRPQTEITFDSSKGFLPIYARMTGRIFLDGKAVEGPNGEYPAIMSEMFTTKIEKVGEVYYPFVTSIKVNVWDMKAAQAISLNQLFHSKEELRPRILQSTTSWLVHKVQPLNAAIPAFELPDNTLIVDTKAK